MSILVSNILRDLSMSDCRLSHDEGFVEVEVEVRGEEYTLSGGQEESYLHRISIRVAAQRKVSYAHAVAIVVSHPISRLLGWVGKWSNWTANKLSVSLGARRNKLRRLTRGMDVLRGFSWKDSTSNRAVRPVSEREGYRTPVEPTKMRG